VLPADHDGANGGLPEIVLAPARPDVRPGHDADVVFEVRRASDGRLALPVFTTVERLVTALGPEQPWVALPLPNIQHIVGAAGVPRIVVDPGAERGAWRWQVSDIEELARRQ
jgi:SseB protein N-terminal domain